MTARKGAVTRSQKGLLKKAAKESKQILTAAPKKSLLDKAIDYFSLGYDSYQIALMLDVSEDKIEKWWKFLNSWLLSTEKCPSVKISRN